MAINLTKPLGSDVYNIEVFNANSTIIEDAINDLSPKVADLLIEVAKKYPYFTDEVDIDNVLDDGIYYNIKNQPKNILISIGKNLSNTIQTLISEEEIKQRTVTSGNIGDWVNLTAAIVDNLVTDDNTKALSAKQGVVLNNTKFDKQTTAETIDVDSINSNGIMIICQNGLTATQTSSPISEDVKKAILVQYGNNTTKAAIQLCYNVERNSVQLRYGNYDDSQEEGKEWTWTNWDYLGGGSGGISLQAVNDYPKG